MSALIRYSLCWEDPYLVINGLKINAQDTVLSIASGGENIFAILLKNPKEIIAIDSNKNQINLVKLKVAAIKELEFDDFVRFTGFKKFNNKKEYFQRCKKHLSYDEIIFWEKNINLIQKGIVHCGRFENYLSLFRKIVLSLVLNEKKINEYLSLRTIKDQTMFFRKNWDGRMWRFLFHIFFSESVMKILGRDKAYFKHNSNNNIALHYYNRSKFGITKIPIQHNYFMHYILTGEIRVPFIGHPYLDENNYLVLKKNIHKIKFIHSDVHSYLRKKLHCSFSKFNLSDIFEMMSQKQYEATIAEIVRTAKKNSRVCYWNNLVERKNHSSLGCVMQDETLSKELFYKDRVFFYSRFIIERIN